MRKNIAVFFGGRSNEHEVSVITGMLAVNLLRGAGYRVMPVYLPKKGGMLIAENARGVDDFRRDRYEKFEEAILYKKSLINLRKPKRIKFSIDCALNCCHGGQGEDGTLSALLHWNGVLSVSPDTAVSAMFMDKSLSKIALRGLHIPVIEDLTVYEEKWETAREEVFAETKVLGYPVIVKPCSLGSSIGIRVARDEKELADTMAKYFGMFGLPAHAEYTADSVKIMPNNIRVVLLDINLGLQSGYDCISVIREKTPTAKILLISARSEERDMLKGYNLGADDYIIKPFSLQVLLLKVKNLISKENVGVEKYKDLIVDKDSMIIKRGEEIIKLKNMEFKLFMYLFNNRGKVLDKDDIILNVWGQGYYSDNTLNIHIRRIREKLEKYQGEFITTVWGTGYKFE